MIIIISSSYHRHIIITSSSSYHHHHHYHIHQSYHHIIIIISSSYQHHIIISSSSSSSSSHHHHHHHIIIIIIIISLAVFSIQNGEMPRWNQHQFYAFIGEIILEAEENPLHQHCAECWFRCDRVLVARGPKARVLSARGSARVLIARGPQARVLSARGPTRVLIARGPRPECCYHEVRPESARSTVLTSQDFPRLWGWFYVNA